MLSSADTHEIAKYARTYIQDTHTQAHIQKKKKEKVERLEGNQRCSRAQVGEHADALARDCTMWPFACLTINQ